MSVAALQLLEGSGVPDAIVPVWMVAHGTHVYLRYLALSALRFPYPNQARCCCAAHASLLLCTYGGWFMKHCPLLLRYGAHRLPAAVLANDETATASKGTGSGRCSGKLHPAVNAAAYLTVRLAVRRASLQKRAAFLVSSYVRTGTVPSVEAGNVAERVLLPPTMCSPRVVYGCTLDQALDHTAAGSGSGNSSGSKGERLAELLRLYDGERYLLTWHSGTAWVLVLEGAQRQDLLRAMLQAAWLELHHSERQAAAAVAGGCEQVLADSLAALQQQWPQFALQAEHSGWQLANAVLPQGTARLRIE